MGFSGGSLEGLIAEKILTVFTSYFIWKYSHYQDAATVNSLP